MKIKNIALIFVFAYAINLVWENLHAPLYTGYNGFIDFFTLGLYASFVDALIITAIFSIISIYKRDFEFLKKKIKIFDILVIVILGLIIAIIIELRALDAGRWFYTELMPTIFGIGLTPLIQLFATSFITFYLTKLIYKKYA